MQFRSCAGENRAGLLCMVADRNHIVERLAAKLVEEEYPVKEWNLYFFHFSDGDNLGSGDDERCFQLLRERILPSANLFGYGQVESRIGSGAFLGSLGNNITADNLILSKIPDRESILDSIRDFLGKGR